MNDRDFRTVAGMLSHGGSFVKQLAMLAQVADAENLARIKATWPEYWDRYERLANARADSKIK